MGEDGKPAVLFVDDEPDLLAGLRLALRRQPFEVLTTTSAKDALSILDERSIGVIVSDERMPEMSGARLLAEVRVRHPEVERIILTGQASMDATIAAINEARVFRFLTKPCGADDLSDVVLAALAARATREKLSEPRHSGELHELSGHLNEALEHIWIALQPIVRASDGELFAFEVLLRSRHDLLAGPLEVLDAATRLDRHFDVDRLIRKQAATVLPHLPAGVSLFVNIVPESLLDGSLLSSLDPLARWSDRVVIEVTERADLEAIEGVGTAIEQIRARGFRLALDDLGAGYAGLTSFAKLQPDIVKLDMGLVRGIESSPTRMKLVASMVRLCRDLGITSVAEGVETEPERDAMAGMGCDLIQGYLTGRPQPAPNGVLA